MNRRHYRTEGRSDEDLRAASVLKTLKNTAQTPLGVSIVTNMSRAMVMKALKRLESLQKVQRNTGTSLYSAVPERVCEYSL